jgi:hypothetical protein
MRIRSCPSDTWTHKPNHQDASFSSRCASKKEHDSNVLSSTSIEKLQECLGIRVRARVLGSRLHVLPNVSFLRLCLADQNRFGCATHGLRPWGVPLGFHSPDSAWLLPNTPQQTSVTKRGLPWIGTCPQVAIQTHNGTSRIQLHVQSQHNQLSMSVRLQGRLSMDWQMLADCGTGRVLHCHLILSVPIQTCSVPF